MPGWYVHMEAAHQTAERLLAGDVGDLGLEPDDAKRLGGYCHKWRNYLAIGALGPDLFYLLPDFKDELGCVIRQVVKWAVEVWQILDEDFIGKWEKWMGPISANNAQLASQLTGGLSVQLASILNDLTAALVTAFEGLLAEMGDWFGILTSGVPQGYDNDGFYWSDMFHYRRTMQFPHVMFSQAMDALDLAMTNGDASAQSDAEARVAFAIGWMTHSGTDTAGHPFTNAKAGGPYRDHWQRHHLVENHIDSQNYGAIHSGPCYGEYGTSALHFWIALTPRSTGPYAGRTDAPLFDYFTGFPSYNTANTPTAASERKQRFDVDSENLPDHLVQALIDAMGSVHGTDPASKDSPKILAKMGAEYSTVTANGVPDGRPNAAALNEMWSIAYTYMKLSGRGGLSPLKPVPPDVITDHSFPTPPGGGSSAVDEDSANGANVNDDSSFSLLDLLLAILAWAEYIAQVIVWLVTILPGLILDLATFPARAAIYYAVEVPVWNLYMLARRALVMSGFLMPMPEEIDPGLVVLGTSKGTFSIATMLDDPTGAATAKNVLSEPSGRWTGQAFGIDRYPLGVVRDDPSDFSEVSLTALFNGGNPLIYAGDSGKQFTPSEWLAPWRYPSSNHVGDQVPQEGSPAHVGPYLVGMDSTVLLSSIKGDAHARADLSNAGSPEETYGFLEKYLPMDQHLGAPIDFNMYLVAKMSADRGQPLSVEDYNLDSDRGYAWHCWDWDRHAPESKTGGDRNDWECIAGRTQFHFQQPCTPPQFFHADTEANNPGPAPADSQWYDPGHSVKASYLDRKPAPMAYVDCKFDLHFVQVDDAWKKFLGQDFGQKYGEK